MKIKFLKYLIEASFTQGYNDNVLAGDDDFPTGNILIGDKYKKVKYYNKLTNFNMNWVPDLGKWTWDEFGAARGQESLDVYHDSLKNSVLSKKMFIHMTNKPPKTIPKELRALGNDIFPDTDAWGNPTKYVPTADTEDDTPEKSDKIAKQSTKDAKEIAENMDIIDKINIFLEEVKAKKAAVSDKQYAGKYYRHNKEKVKRNKIELGRSIEGQKRNRMEPIMGKQRKTPTGRHKVNYS